MKKFIFIIYILSIPNQIYSQTNKFIDSLINNNCKEIIVLKENCLGCLVLNKPCENYGNNGNFQDYFIFWRINKKTYVRKSNVCGNSKVYEIRKWNKNPFDLLNSKSAELDTLKLKYPLSLNRDSTWVETKLSHNTFSTLSFPTNKIKKIEINHKAFNDIKKIEKSDEEYMKMDIEFKKNIYRYIFNNNSSVKELLDILNKKIFEVKKKIRV